MISIISRTYWPATMGGAEKYTHEIKERLSSEYDLKVYTWDDSKEKDVIKVSIPKIKLAGALLFSIKASRLINNSDAKLVHVSQYWTEYAPYLLKKKFISTIYDLPDDKLRMKVMMRSASSSDKIIYIAESVKNELVSKGINEEKFVFAPPGVDESVRRKTKTKHEGIILTHVSRIAPNKDLITIIKALSMIRKKYDFTLYVIGQKMEWTDYYRKVLEEIKKNKMEKNVKLLGTVSDEEKNKLLHLSNAYLHASYYGEGFGMPVVEAQAAGVPVVTSDLFEKTGVAVKDRNASVFPARNASRMSEEIDKILGDSSYRKRIVSGGLESSKNYDWTKTSKTISKIYKLY